MKLRHSEVREILRQAGDESENLTLWSLFWLGPVTREEVTNDHIIQK